MHVARLCTRPVCIPAVAWPGQTNAALSCPARPPAPCTPCLQQAEQPPAAAAAGAASIADALLGDYVSLGILEDPSAAAKKEAVTARQSVRPELLTAVPWAASLKGIRSPLLRLHQGES